METYQQQQFTGIEGRPAQQTPGWMQSPTGSVQGGGFDHKAVLAGANMQHGNPHDLDKAMKAVMAQIEPVATPGATIDEAAAVAAHREVYANYHHDAHSLTSKQMGEAAAVEAIKHFGQMGLRQAQEGPGHQHLISKLMGMAMSEGVDLYQKSKGSADHGSVVDVMASAGQTIVRMVIQNQIPGALANTSVGGSGGANASQLMWLAEKLGKY